MMDMYRLKNSFRAMSPEVLLKELGSGLSGISDDEALRRKQTSAEKKELSPFAADIVLFFSQFKNPLTILLFFALIVSAFVKEYSNALIILGILLITGLLGFLQERNAGKAVEKLRKMVQVQVLIRRNGNICKVSTAEVVEGDIILLEAGDIIPADSLIIESKDLFVNEALLTGESFPAEKKAGVCPESTPLAKQFNVVFKGTNVISGTATVVAVLTGSKTELGSIQKNMRVIINETAFEKGIRRFGYMLMRAALILAGIILIVNISLGKPAIDSVLFALALSIGLAPELLPAIVTITLSAGAKRLAEKNVIVKRLSSIQNLGSINILCSDKTGTLTEGEVKIHGYIGCDGKPSPQIQQYAYLNAIFESGYANPMDEAIRKYAASDISMYKKFDEVPYDFIRKRLSIVVENQGKHLMITKGALKNILEICSTARLVDGKEIPIADFTKEIDARFQEFSSQGFRTIGICCKDVTNDPVIDKRDENQMVFLGFILLNDPPKEGIIDTINALKKKNVDLKIITGDNSLVAAAIAKQIGLEKNTIVTGEQMQSMSEEALVKLVNETAIFSEADPSQKERIIRALQKNGHIVGYMGDGINDASALRAADVGISMNNAADIAKEAADLILLEKDLNIMSEGISEGRKTFQNTLKYIFITISANFGNMFSMAGASLLLPFLPLMPVQILLMNFLSDIPALAIASDKVDEELLAQPRKWDIKMIQRFMIVFGLESSVFDYITFGTLMLFFKTNETLFQTGWFLESVITAVFTLLIVRTRRTFLQSRPGKYLFLAGMGVVLFVIVLPFTPVARNFGFMALSPSILFSMIGICLVFGITAEVTKKIFFRKLKY